MKILDHSIPEGGCSEYPSKLVPGGFSVGVAELFVEAIVLPEQSWREFAATGGSRRGRDSV